MANVDSIAVAPTGSDPAPRSDQAPQPPDGSGRAPAARVRALVAAAPVLLTDGAVVAFALWTVLYHLAFLFGLAPSTTFLIWIGGCLVALGGSLWWRRRGRASAAAGRVREAVEGAAPAYPRPLLALVLGAGTVAAVTAGLTTVDDGVGEGIPWWIPGGFGALAAAGAMFLVRRRWLATPAGDAAAAAATRSRRRTP